MLPVTYNDIIEYRKKLDREIEVLLISPVFTFQEKTDLKENYNNLITICNVKIASHLEVNDAFIL